MAASPLQPLHFPRQVRGSHVVRALAALSACSSSPNRCVKPSTSSPHAGWAVKQLRTLPVKGMGLLVFNEIFAFLMPPLLVLLLRMFIDPIGWQTWSEVINTGGALLMLALFFWSLPTCSVWLGCAAC